MPHRQLLVSVPTMSSMMLPETHVLMMKGVAGMYENRRRLRSEVVSAIRISTRRMRPE